MDIKITLDPNKSKNPVLRRIFTTIHFDQKKEEDLNGYKVKTKEGETLGRIQNTGADYFIVAEDFTNKTVTEEEHKKYAEELIAKFESADKVITEDSTLKSIDVEEIELATLSLDPPKGYFWLGSIFETPEDQMRYEEFLEDPIMLKRFEKYCDVKKIEIKEGDVRNSIHVKDSATEEVLVLEYVVKQFEQYMFSSNFIKGFDKGTYEYDLGKVMRLSPKFCDYVFTQALEAEVKGENLESDEHFENELHRAIKEISKNPYLMGLYENDLFFSSIINK